MLRFLYPALLLTACTETPSQPARAAATVLTSGLDPALLAATVAQAERLPRLRSLLILRDDREVAGRTFNGGPALGSPVTVKSASKTILSAIAGIAIARGVLSGTDQPIAPILRADLPANPDPRLARITIGDLLSMRSGLERTSGENYGRWVSSPNWVRYALSRPFVGDPGGAMIYSTGNSHLLSAVLTRAAGRSTHALTKEWLADPLGIAIPPWPRDPQGIYFGGNDMRLSPRGLAAFGELYRNDGMANGRRILPAGWVGDSWRSRGTSPWSGNGYGYGWFESVAAGHAVHFAWGYGGQMIYVVPDLAVTVVMTSDASPHPRADSHVPALHALLADGIVPAAEKGNGAPER